MRRSRLLLSGVCLLVLALAAAAALIQYQRKTVDDALPVLQEIDTSDLIGLPRPDFHLPDRDGRQRQAAEWDGDVLMVNFWASWCVPCRREIPELIELQAEYGESGLRIVGIALDEQAQVERFLAGLGIEVKYPLLISPDLEGIALARAYGNGVGILPYTVLVDRAGRIMYAQFGELTRAQAEREIRPLL